MDGTPPRTNLPGIETSLSEEYPPDTVSIALPDDFAAVVRQLRELEQRVRALEERSGASPARAVPASSGSITTRARTRGEPTAKVIPVVGEALLAIAGAYLLRALTEYKVVPPTLGVVAGILYAAVWLMLAARAAARRPIVGGIRGVTSALILAPLLVEATIVFSALSTGTAAVVIIIYSCLGLGVSWRNNLAVTVWTTTLSGLLAAVALLLATRDVVPFTLALLGIAAIMECFACFDRWLHERWIVAFIADLVVLFLTSIAARHPAPEAYVPISTTMAVALQLVLPAIYLSSTSLRSLARGTILTVFEIIQIVLVLLLSMTGVLRITQGVPVAVESVAFFSLLCGVLFYRFSFGFGRSAAESRRNHYAYSILGLLLVLAGSVMQFSGAALALVLSASTLLALLIARLAEQATFRWHAAAYLLAATILSHLANCGAANLLGQSDHWTAPTTAGVITAITAALAYFLIWRSSHGWRSASASSVPVLAVSAIAVWALAGFAAAVLTGGIGSAVVGPMSAALRTFVLTALAVLLALGGTAWKRRELVWLMYPFMALTAYKLLVQDLPRGHTLSLFVSLFVFGGALILLPRILQKSSASN